MKMLKLEVVYWFSESGDGEPTARVTAVTHLLWVTAVTSLVG